MTVVELGGSDTHMNGHLCSLVQTQWHAHSPCHTHAAHTWTSTHVQPPVHLKRHRGLPWGQSLQPEAATKTGPPRHQLSRVLGIQGDSNSCWRVAPEARPILPAAQFLGGRPNPAPPGHPVLQEQPQSLGDSQNSESRRHPQRGFPGQADTPQPSGGSPRPGPRAHPDSAVAVQGAAATLPVPDPASDVGVTRRVGVSRWGHVEDMG